METSDALLIVPAEQEGPDPFKGHEPTAAEANAFKDDGSLPERVKAGAKEKPRDGGGRFTKVLANWKEDAGYRQALLDGAIEPDESMDPETWAAARRAQIERGTSNITAPKSESEKTEGAKPTENGKAAEPIPEPTIPLDHPHRTRMRDAAGWYPDWREAAEAADKLPISPGLAKAIAELPNSGDVCYSLAKNPEIYAKLLTLAPKRATEELRKIANIVEYGSATAPGETKAKPKAAEMFPPPEPVGARSTSRAFDVSDETLSPDEWQKKRNEQVRKRAQ